MTDAVYICMDSSSQYSVLLLGSVCHKEDDHKVFFQRNNVIIIVRECLSSIYNLLSVFTLVSVGTLVYVLQTM